MKKRNNNCNFCGEYFDKSDSTNYWVTINKKGFQSKNELDDDYTWFPPSRTTICSSCFLKYIDEKLRAIMGKVVTSKEIIDLIKHENNGEQINKTEINKLAMRIHYNHNPKTDTLYNLNMIITEWVEQIRGDKK